MKPVLIEGPVQSDLASQACEKVLRALPDWFGIEEAVVGYIREAAELPTWVASSGAGPVGFLTVKQHFACSAEIYVMGVLPGFQRCGVGRRLVDSAEQWLRAAGVEYMQVKTLAPSHPDPYYARTRAFYESIGFRPLEAFPQLWNAENPCLLMVKASKGQWVKE